MRIGIDSTDTTAGGCTTHAALEAWAAVATLGVLGYPRLVRLNPNVPYKTRGNGAVCLELGHGRGRGHVVGEIHGVCLYGYERVDPLTPGEAASVFQSIARRVAALRANDDQAAATGLVALEGPDPGRYEDAVRRHVPFDGPTPVPGALFQAHWGTGRGLVGAAAAAAWPAESGTYEWIGYRAADRWGTPRKLDPTLGEEISAQEPSTFDNWDAVHRHLRLAPASPCPILAGIRGTDPKALRRAEARVGPEPATAWILMESNQGTGDHLQNHRLSEISPYETVRTQVRVMDAPRTRSGGHVFVSVRDETGSATVAAFEPTKEFRDGVRAWRPGDRVEIEAAAHLEPDRLALEAWTLVEAAPPGARLVPPACPTCGGSLQSEGRKGGYRCRRDGARVGAGAARQVPVVRTMPAPGRRQVVPVSVRRHLARPPNVAPVPLRLASAMVSA